VVKAPSKNPAIVVVPGRALNKTLMFEGAHARAITGLPESCGVVLAPGENPTPVVIPSRAQNFAVMFEIWGYGLPRL
jgi:hypothetical protein